MSQSSETDARHQQYLERMREQHRERIIKEGFEVSAYDADEGEGCEYSTVVQVSPRKRITRPCGKPVLVALKFMGPQNPDGVQVNFCRECLAEHIRDIMRYLT
jgi:hypothetical protein